MCPSEQPIRHLFRFVQTFLVAALFAWVSNSLCQAASLATATQNEPCPRSDLSKLVVQNHVTPWGNESSGSYTKVEEADTLHDCIKACCNDDKCDVVFFFNTTCYLISCVSQKMCSPLHRNGNKFDHAYIVQVHSVRGDDFDGNSQSDQMLPIVYETEDDVEVAGQESQIEPSWLSATKACVFGLAVDCNINEHCEPKNNRARQGVCHCNAGYQRDNSGKCSLLLISSSSSSTTLFTTEITMTSTETVPPMKHLVVSAGEDVVLFLPENSVTLSAYALPTPPAGEKYLFEWTLLEHPLKADATGLMENKNTPNLKLTQLSEGVYRFQVSVKGNGAYGENQINVTVLPAKHDNKPPVAVIQPNNVTVQLPNKDTVLDGSYSKDDDKIENYHWEAVVVPIGYKLLLNDTSTLQLKNLTPGFYRFKLTVTDSRGASNYTFANLTVLKETDYPPTANAGDDLVIFIPNNEGTLNGNLSTDDKGIKSWLWTKSPDVSLPVDVEGTTSPYLHLSNLVVGVYKFILKVTDTTNQTSEQEVHVFVKPESNKPPTANAGPDQKISLPLDGPVVLDGSKSNGDIGISKWSWEQISGPKTIKLEDGDKSKAKASGLTPGDYVFRLTVFDAKGGNSSANVSISIIQTKNIPPRAVAGGDKTVHLPSNVVFLNGSCSTDDVGITSYLWTREPSSLAAGDIIEGSDKSAILKLTNLIAGRYLFRLTVTDSQGASSFDTTSLIVKLPSDKKDQVEIVVNADIKTFTHEQLETVLKKLELLVHVTDPIHVHLEKLDADRLSRRVILIFVVKKNGGNEIVPGSEVIARLKKKLWTDSSLFDMEVLSINAVVCQNSCSGHGSCDPYTRHCMCEAFWMHNILRIHFGDQESNCDWSILYVIIVGFLVLLSTVGCGWALTFFCTRMRFRRPKRKSKYMLLDELSDREKDSTELLHQGKQQENSIMVSESDSDTLFETCRKPLSSKMNGHRPNGYVKEARKVRA